MSNLTAFLDAIAFSELGGLLKVSNNGYDVIVGSTVAHPDLFTSYADHPRKLVHLNAHLESTAAGRYQLLARFYDAYKKQLDLPDFSPPSQDAIAATQIAERGAMNDVLSGYFDSAIAKCGHIWASLPGSPYGQHTNTIESLRAVFIAAGGTIGG